jgi:hypothetical protein
MPNLKKKGHKMRLTTEYELTGDKCEDWVLVLLYMTGDEIAKCELVPNGYDGGDYDWITLPTRDYGAKEGEHLVAAYGGTMTELCLNLSRQSPTTAHEATYYCGVGCEDDVHYLDRLGYDLADRIKDAPKNSYGSYDDGEVANPHYSRERGWYDLDNLDDLDDDDDDKAKPYRYEFGA